MKKIFTLISVAFVAMSVNAQSTESFVAVDADGNLASQFADVVSTQDGKTATNVVNGNSIVMFSTTNVEVEAVGSAEPAALDKGEDLTIGASIGENRYEYTINSSKQITWQTANQGDISYNYVKGTGKPAVSAYAEEILTDGAPTGAYRLAYVAFDPATGGLPITGLYYKITTKAAGALKVGIWGNKGNHPTYLVDAETKQVSNFLVEGYINGQNGADGKKKWLTNAEIAQIHTDLNQTNPYVIGGGNQPFWGNVIFDTAANKTYYLFQGTTQIGFQGYTFAPGKSKEDMLTGIEAVKAVAEQNADAPVYNLSGQQVSKDYKGVVIQNGVKRIQK